MAEDPGHIRECFIRRNGIQIWLHLVPISDMGGDRRPFDNPEGHTPTDTCSPARLSFVLGTPSKRGDTSQRVEVTGPTIICVFKEKSEHT